MPVPANEWTPIMRKLLLPAVALSLLAAPTIAMAKSSTAAPKAEKTMKVEKPVKAKKPHKAKKAS